MKYGTSFVVIM